MKNKFILITLIFFIIFSFLLSSVCSANFIVNYEGKKLDFGDIEENLKEFTFVFPYHYKGEFQYLMLFSSTIEPVVLPNDLVRVRGTCFQGAYDNGKFRVLRNNVEYNSDTAFSVSSMGTGLIYSTFNLKDLDGNIVFKEVGKNPFIVNKDEVTSGNFKSLVINTGDFSIDDNLTLSVNELRPVSNGSDFTYYLNKTKKFDLDSSMEGLTLTNAAGTNSIFSIPSSKFFVFMPGYKYEFIIKKGTEELCYESFVCGEISAEDKEQNEKDKQLELQEEQNKTNKGIWDTLKEVLNFINPFSENFFVYKLLELMANLIKSLFIPSDDFFTNWINNMNDWLSDRLGALYYPVDLVVDFLNRIGELSATGSAVISGDGFEFMGAKLIPAFSYDLNALLTNDTLKNIHDIYLTVVDVILYLCLIVLAKNTFVDIFRWSI